MSVNLNLDSFRAMVGKNNYGEVRLNREGGLEKVNNHFLQREWKIGMQKINSSESQYIREMFMKSVANATVDKQTLDNIRLKLGIETAGGQTSSAPLDRRTIAEVLEMVDKSNSEKVNDFNRRDVKTFNTYFDTIFGYKDSFKDSQLSGMKLPNGTAYMPTQKQGVNVSAMRAVIGQWNSKNPKLQINLSDDQLTVLFNRHGLQLRNSMVKKFLGAQTKARQADSSLINYFNQNFKKAFGEELCREIRGIMKNDNLESGATGLGVQGETRTTQDKNFIRQMAENKRTGSGFKFANSTLRMSPGGVARFCDNYKQVDNAIKNNDMKLSEETLFKPEDFEYEPYHGDSKETTQGIFNNTVGEVGRVPMKVVVQSPSGEELTTAQFKKTVKPNSINKADVDEANKTNAKIKTDNSDVLTGLMDTINKNQLLSDNKNQMNKLLKAMGQKFVASVTNNIGWNDRDEDRKLVLKFNNDHTISATLYFKTQDTGKRMEFDFNIDEHGAVERKYLGPQDQVEAAKAGTSKVDDDLNLGVSDNEKTNAEDFAKTINSWDD